MLLGLISCDKILFLTNEKEKSSFFREMSDMNNALTTRVYYFSSIYISLATKMMRVGECVVLLRVESLPFRLSTGLICQRHRFAQRARECGFCVGTVRGMGGSPLVGWVRSRRLSERPPGAEATRAAAAASIASLHHALVSLIKDFQGQVFI